MRARKGKVTQRDKKETRQRPGGIGMARFKHRGRHKKVHQMDDSLDA